MPESCILVLNVGSSTLKYALYETDTLTCIERATLEGATGFSQIAAKCAGRSIGAVGHRLVHGGEAYTTATVIDERVFSRLKSLVPLAPLHLPAEIRGIEESQKLFPDAMQVAAFDTAFHASQPFLATQFALPEAITTQGVRRYGFHGLSYASIARQLAAQGQGGKVIVAHLGSGASVCALQDGVSVATSMGFSALEGLMMGTRCGRLDAGVLLYLLEQGYTIGQLTDLLYKQSGLLGVSGISSDMRVLENSTDPKAERAIDLFCYRAASEMGALIPLLGGVDVFVFTGGIGEHSKQVREKITAYFGWLPALKTLVLQTDEETEIAHQVKNLLFQICYGSMIF
jgi:acetate kinase